MQRNWQDLIQPRSVEAEKLSDFYGKFTVGPLERGYGLTLGNSLRRVLLSSINGAAIVAVRIEGVDHEFFNLKQVSLRYLGNQDATIRIQTSKDGVVYARDIETGSDVEVINGDQPIATIGGGASLNMELLVRHGRGYAISETNRKEADLPVGMIAIDSIFAPVRRVAYNVSNARVGQMTDYDKLSVEIWTNGTVKPDDALAYGAKILKEQLNPFINFDEVAHDVKVEKEVVDEKPSLNENLFKTVDSLELSVRAANCLENANIKYIGELVTKSELEMLKTKNFGRKSLNEIKDILSEMGLSLGMRIEGFDPSMLREKDETPQPIIRPDF